MASLGRRRQTPGRGQGTRRAKRPKNRAFRRRPSTTRPKGSSGPRTWAPHAIARRRKRRAVKKATAAKRRGSPRRRSILVRWPNGKPARSLSGPTSRGPTTRRTLLYCRARRQPRCSRHRSIWTRRAPSWWWSARWPTDVLPRLCRRVRLRDMPALMPARWKAKRSPDAEDDSPVAPAG